MKKPLLLFLISLSTLYNFAQEKEQGWTRKGNARFLFNQTAFSNWVAGGENSVSGNISFNYDFNFFKDNLTWNNKVMMSYGLSKVKNTDFEKKTDDRFEFNSLFGKRAEKKWYYSALFNFKTQFSKGYKYSKDSNGKEIRTEHTAFMSPANILIGPGLLWEKNSNLKINIAPSTGKIVIVDPEFTLPDNKYFGVEEGKSTRLELGFSASMMYKFSLMENVNFENRLALYSNYLENIANVDVDYYLNVTMKVNKYLSTNLIFQIIYDDNAIKAVQLREVFGIGVNYAF